MKKKPASNLIEKDYYRWIFDNEPEWEGISLISGKSVCCPL